MDKSFYQKMNNEQYSNEITTLIHNKKERINEFIQDWLSFEKPPFDFIKAMFNISNEQSVKFFDLLVEEIIKQKRLELITPFLTFQIKTPMSFIYKAIDNEQITVLDYLIHDDAFFIPHSKNNEIYTYIWSKSNADFAYQAEKLLFDNSMTPSKKMFENKEFLEKLMCSIIASNHFEYVLFIEKKMDFKFEEKNIENYDSDWEINLKNKSFYYLEPKTQSDFLNLFMKMDKNRDKLRILRKYFVLKNHNKAKPVDNEVFLEVFDNLIQMNTLKLDECKKYLDVCDYKNFFQDYETYSEKRKLNQEIKQSVKYNEKKLKI